MVWEIGKSHKTGNGMPIQMLVKGMCIQLKLKKITGVFLAVLIAASAFSGLITANAQTQALTPKNPSYAWLEELFVREATDQPGYCAMKPIAEWPYSRTLSEFRQEIGLYLKTYMNPESLSENYIFVLQQIDALMRAMGINETHAEKKAWLEKEYKIVFPPEGTDANVELKTSVLFGILKYDMYYIFFGEKRDFEIPTGSTLDEAIIIVLNSGMKLPLDVPIDSLKTLDDYALAVARTQLKNKGYPVDENSSREEVMRYLTIATIGEAGYIISEAASDSELKTAAFAAFIYTRYGIMIPLGKTQLILYDEEMTDAQRQEAVVRLVLMTMANERGETVSEEDSTEKLFNAALKVGYFELGDDFYSDVYKYRVELSYLRDQVWITPFSYAGLMKGGDVNKAKITINGAAATNKRPLKVELNKKVKEQTIKVVVSYKSGSISETRQYEIVFVQGKELPPASWIDVVSSNLATRYSSTGRQFVTSADGYTYFQGDIDRLPLEALITDESGVVIGVDSGAIGSPQTSGNDETTSEYIENNEGGSKIWGGIKFLLKHWYYLLAGLAAVAAIVAAIVYFSMKRKAKIPSSEKAPKKGKEKKPKEKKVRVSRKKTVPRV